MRELLILIFYLFTLQVSIHYNSSHWKTEFYDFVHLKIINFTKLQNLSSDYEPDIISGTLVEKFYINFEGPTFHECNNISIACIKFYDDPILYRITTAKSWEKQIIGNNLKFIDDKNTDFILPNSEVIINGQKIQITLLIHFLCDETIDFYSNLSTDININLTTYSIVSRNSCSSNINNFDSFINSIRIFLGPILIIIGLFISSTHTYFIRGKVFVINFIFFTFVSIWILKTFTILNFSNNNLTLLILSISLGIAISILFSFVYYIGILIIIAILGFVFYLLLYSIALTSFKISYWVIIPSSLGSIILFCIWQKKLFLFAKAFIGSYLIIRGIGFLFGNYPLEGILFYMKKSEEKIEIMQYIYFSCIIILFFINFCELVQTRRGNNVFKWVKQTHHHYYLDFD